MIIGEVWFIDSNITDTLAEHHNIVTIDNPAAIWDNFKKRGKERTTKEQG